MQSTILINIKTSTDNSKRNFYIAEKGLIGTVSIGLKFVHLSIYRLKTEKVEPHGFEIFQFKNSKQKQN